MIYVFVLLMTLTGAFGTFLFKKSANSMKSIFSLLSVRVFYLGGFLHILNALMNVVLLRFMDYTVLYPMTSVTYIWSLFISNRFLREPITKKKIMGIVLVCLGVVLLVQ